MFKVNGIDNVLYLDGSMTVEARSDVLRKFQVDDKHRVLILSRVGLQGLNITCANIMIMLVWQVTIALIYLICD